MEENSNRLCTEQDRLCIFSWSKLDRWSAEFGGQNMVGSVQSDNADKYCIANVLYIVG